MNDRYAKMKAAFEKQQSNRGMAAIYEGDGHYKHPATQREWENWQDAWQAATEAAKATGTAGEREIPSVQRVITQLETAERGFICPLCGKGYPHGHTPAEISIYRNGIKAAARQEELAGAEHPGVTEDAGLDASATSTSGGVGSHQRHEHRGRQSGNQRLNCGSDGACDGLPGSGEVREAVAEAARQPAPVTLGDEEILMMASQHGVESREFSDECIISLVRAALAATNRSQP